MDKLRFLLPSPSALVTFECAARLLNFTRAAEELGVTQAAVSRQIKNLEQHIGRPLFIRAERRLSLTPAGAKLKDAVAYGLGHIAGAITGVRRVSAANAVSVAASVTFSSYWLMSRVAQFRAQHPGVDLRLVATANARQRSDECDLAIRYGHGDWQGMDAHHMFDNDVFPVCAPAYLARHRKKQGAIHDLDGETLLHLAQFDRNWVSWATWFDRFGGGVTPKNAGLSYDNYLVLIHAVVAGEGIALCGGRLAHDLLARGDVVRIGSQALKSDRAFYLVHPQGAPLSRAARQFRQWLLEEARQSGARITPPLATPALPAPPAPHRT
jgi:LysR family transcriptional regulator, glycine cleavage system transcriptional activator